MSARALNILLVEDDALIRVNTTEMMSDIGHTVLEAGSASEALVMLAKGSVEILVTDLGLPDMPGHELALKAREMLPDLGVVFASGDNATPVEIPNAFMLTKPYDIDGLRAAIVMAAKG